jgi:AAA15 family ATPase/GTPase
MLIRFSVENHLSIRGKQEISLVASSLKDKGADLISWGNQWLLPAALIYGANASGKSNFISALSYFRNLVVFSHSRGTPDGTLSRVPFRLDGKSQQKPSVFDIDFVINGTRFHFGYSISDREVLEEWLFAFPSGKKQTWYLRNKNKRHIYFGKNLRGQTKIIESLTRPNSLFLSAAAQNSHKQLTPVYNFIREISLHVPEEGETAAIVAFRDGKIDSRIMAFLKNADTGIVDCHFEEVPKDQRSAAMMADLVQLFKKHKLGGRELKPEDLEYKIVSLGHETKSGKPSYLTFSLESTGTIRLMLLLKSIFEALDRGSLVVIDELDTSLHTYLTERIVAIFNSRRTNPKGAQLLAATHDTNLLSSNSVRRDEVWFAEKDDFGATVFYPLTDIRTRNTDNLEKGYLQGRFGAVPFRGPIDSLFRDA